MPPASLTAPTISTLKQGDTIHRVHQTTFASASFNPCGGQPTRFAPVQDTAGACVPSLYAGSTLPAAIHETIFHDIPAKAKLKTIPKQDVLIRSHSELQAMRDIELALLTNVTLGAWKIARKDLIESGAKLYVQTVQWAEAIHHQFPNVDGLVWTSRQCDPDLAYLFFGDRVQSSDFKTALTRDGATDKSFLKDVRDEGKHRGITITV